jgi:MFS family permease
VSALVDRVVPARLGTGFRWLLASSWVSNLGDGIVLAAGPLLVASQTDSAFLVALAATLQWAPPLLFGLQAGVLTDRLDRRRIIVVTNLFRAVALGVLTLTILTDAVSITVVLTTMFVLGTAELFADNAAATVTPMLVARDDLTVANSRLMAGFITVNQLAGPPLGAALFGLGMGVPFASQAVLVAGGALLVARITLPPHGRDAAAPTRAMRHDVAEALRWVWHHAAVRTLVLTIASFNITFGAAWSVLVLYATEHLGLGAVGFGLVTTFSAAGGLLGTVSYGWLTRRVSLGNLMRAGLIIETLTHVGLAATSSPVVALPVFFAFGAHAFIWGTTSITIRQRAVPSALQGRVTSVNSLGTFGPLVVGSLIGGALAERWGVTAPFWFAAAGSAVFVVAIWRQLRHIAHADEAPESPDMSSEEPAAPLPT